MMNKLVRAASTRDLAGPDGFTAPSLTAAYPLAHYDVTIPCTVDGIGCKTARRLREHAKTAAAWYSVIYLTVDVLRCIDGYSYRCVLTPIVVTQVVLNSIGVAKSTPLPRSDYDDVA